MENNKGLTLFYEIRNKKVCVEMYISDNKISKKDADRIRKMKQNDLALEEFLKVLGRSYKLRVNIFLKSSKRNMLDAVDNLAKYVAIRVNAHVAHGVNVAAANYKHSDKDRHAMYQEKFIVCEEQFEDL